MRPGNEVNRRFSELLADGRTAVTIIGGRFNGRVGALVSSEGSMCVVDLDDDSEGIAAEVRVLSRNVYKVLT